MGFLAGKKLLITGVLSNRSIAYGIARACHQQGAELAFSYVGERFKDRISEFAAEFGSKLVFDCDVADDAQIEKMFADLSATWGKFDGFVHSIGFAPREAIAGNFLEGLSREGFRIAHDISAYSFPAMAKAALPYLNDKSSLLTLSYLGALRSIPNYNTMGLAKASLEASVRYLAEAVGRTADGRAIRANGISAGPIKTLAASGIKDFGKLLGRVADAAPLRRNVTIEDVGNVAAFLLSDLASGLIGGLGLLPSSNLGEEFAMFEAVHGSAPDIAGKGIANPTALLWSACMMLEHLGQMECAAKIRRSVDTVLEEGAFNTPDIGGNATTAEYVEEIIKRL